MLTGNREKKGLQKRRNSSCRYPSGFQIPEVEQTSTKECINFKKFHYNLLFAAPNPKNPSVPLKIQCTRMQL